MNAANHLQFFVRYWYKLYHDNYFELMDNFIEGDILFLMILLIYQQFITVLHALAQNVSENL